MYFPGEGEGKSVCIQLQMIIFVCRQYLHRRLPGLDDHLPDKIEGNQNNISWSSL